MTTRGKGTALGDLAAEIGADQGKSVAHTGGVAREARGGDDDAAGDLFAAEVAPFEGGTVAPPVKRGPGRPAGSPNRSTLQLQRLLMARGYRDPAEFLASLISTDPRILAARLKGLPDEASAIGAGNPALASGAGVTFDQALEALKVQKAAAAELLPYFHQRLPQQVEHKGDAARPLIVIMDGPGGARPAGGAGGAMSVLDLDAEDVIGEADQGLDGAEPDRRATKSDE